MALLDLILNEKRLKKRWVISLEVVGEHPLYHARTHLLPSISLSLFNMLFFTLMDLVVSHQEEWLKTDNRTAILLCKNTFAPKSFARIQPAARIAKQWIEITRELGSVIWAQEPDGATRDQPKQGKHAAMLKTQNGVRCLGQNTLWKPMHLHLTLTMHLRRMS